MRVRRSAALTLLLLAARISIIFGHEAERSNEKAIRVAIIGGGVGAAVLADALGRELPSASLHVFEREKRLGGRVMTHEMDGIAFEVGGTIILDKNWLMRNLTESLGLHWGESKLQSELECDQQHSDTCGFDPERRTARAHETIGELKERVGIFDGDKFVATLDQTWLDIPRLLWQYGLSPRTANNLAENVAERFFRIYPLLASGRTFADVEELYTSLGLMDTIHANAREFALNAGVSKEWTDEFIAAVTRVNYMQNPREMNALSAMVSIMGSGDSLMQPEAGFANVVAKSFARAKAVVRVGVGVRQVDNVAANGESPRFTLATEPANVGVDSGEFDFVVVAAPLELTDLTLGEGVRVNAAAEGLATAGVARQRRKYRTVYASFVSGYLNPTLFGTNPPEVVLTSDTGSELPFNSIGKKGDGKSGRPLWKVFSHEKLTTDVLARTFTNYSSDTIFVKRWEAYPLAVPVQEGSEAKRSQLLPFVLAKNLFYINAIDMPFSCMEASAVGARNVANMIINAQ